MSGARTDAAAARRLAPLLVLSPSVAVVGVWFGVALVVLLLYSFYTADPGGTMRPLLTWTNYTRFLFDSLYYRVIWRSLELGVTVTLWCLVLGFPLAYRLARTRSSVRPGLVVMLLLFPLMTA